MQLPAAVQGPSWASIPQPLPFAMTVGDSERWLMQEEAVPSHGTSQETGTQRLLTWEQFISKVPFLREKKQLLESLN